MKKVKMLLTICVFILVFTPMVSAAISRTGSRSDVDGYKYTGTVDSAGSKSNPESGIFLNVSGANPFEENIVTSGTVNGDCRFHDGAGWRETIEDSGASFSSTITGGSMVYQTTDNYWGISSGGYYTDSNARVSNIFRDYGCNDGYIVYGFNPSPTDWTKVMDGNLVVITSGAGIGQVRLVKMTTNNTLWFWTNWETVPANGDSFVVLYAPHDIVRNNGAAGTITYKNKGRQIAFVEIDDNTRYADSGAVTGFGWAGYAASYTDRYPEGTGWSSTHRRYANSNWYLGEWNPIAETCGMGAFMLNYGESSYSAGPFGEWQSTAPDAYLYCSFGHGGFAFQGVGAPTETAHSYWTGNEISVDDYGAASAIDTRYNFFYYSGGNWGEPGWWSQAPGNPTVRDPIGVFTGSSIGWGMARLWANAGDPDKYWYRWINANLDLNDYFATAGVSSQIAWYIWDSTDMDETIYFAKSFNLKLVDVNNNPIANATVDIKNNWGETVSYVGSGSSITEDLTEGETGIDVTDGTMFSVGDKIRIDQEYMNITNIAGNTLTVTREAFHSHGYKASEHDSNAIGYDPKVYIVQTVTTDANGQVPEQELDIGYWNYNAHQVYHNGDGTWRYYTAKGRHQADSTNEPGVGASWTTYWTQDSGTEKLKWREDTYYAESYPGSGGGENSMHNLNPFTVSIDKSEFFKYDSSFTWDMDNTGVDWTITLYKWYDLEGFSYLVMDKVNNFVRFFKN